jgi:hypothetical protein
MYLRSGPLKLGSLNFLRSIPVLRSFPARRSCGTIISSFALNVQQGFKGCGKKGRDFASSLLNVFKEVN